MGLAQAVLKRVAIFAVFGLVLAACAAKSSAGSSGGSSAIPQPSNTATAVTIGTDRVDGIGTVLDTAAGLTLYHNSRESNGSIACTGSCLADWPPVIVSGAVPAEPNATSGAFGTVMRPDGTTQLALNGMPLYTFAGDSGAGQASGQGLHQDGVWFAVGPNGSTTMSSGSSGTTNGTSGGSTGSSGGGAGW
jgi:predicted lipoprotein with Yx(FWY)xxD motif